MHMSASIHYQAELDAGRFCIQHCSACARHVFTPRELCPHCGAAGLRWVRPSGRGTVYSCSTIQRKPEAGGNYNVSLIELEEGVRLMSRVEGLAPEQVRIGQTVQARVAQHGGRGIVLFDALPSEASSTSRPTSTPVLGRAASTPKSALDAAAVNRHLRGRVAVAGAATYGCGESPGMDDMTLLVRAAQAAVADAGLSMQDIDGIATCSVTASMWAMPVIEHLGINPSYIDGTMLGGSSFIAHLLPAVRALEAGQCKAVLICYGSAQRSATFGRKESQAARRFLDPQPYEHTFDPVLPVTAYALAAARHMHEFGTTREQLAEVAVAARAWAQQNPEAFMRDPLTVQDVLAARPIASPLGVRDCCLVTDGGGAIVLVRAEHAQELPQPPVYVLGSATAVWNRQISCMHDLSVTAASQSGAQAFAMAGLRASDMDMAQLYDAFTINTLLFLEDLGFCAKGEGGGFVQDGGIAPGGRLAVNTNGGGLSCVHPGMYGIFALIEAVRQLRGQAGQRQLARHRTAVVHGNGGTLSSQATAVLGTAEAL